MWKLIKTIVGFLLICIVAISFKKGYDRYKSVPREQAFGDIGDVVGSFIGWVSDPNDEWKDQLIDYVNSFFRADSNSADSRTDEVTLEEVVIERVVDGDTVIVIDDGGTSFRVRLIGVDTPESVNPDESKNTEEGVYASEYTKSRLHSGDTVYLQYDVAKTDKYDRTLAYLWLVGDVDVTSVEDVQKYMYNAELIIEGYAVPLRIEPNVMYAKVFDEIYNSIN